MTELAENRFCIEIAFISYSYHLIEYPEYCYDDYRILWKGYNGNQAKLQMAAALFCINKDYYQIVGHVITPFEKVTFKCIKNCYELI